MADEPDAGAPGDATDPTEPAETGVSLSPPGPAPTTAEQPAQPAPAADTAETAEPTDPPADHAEGEGPFTFRALTERPQATCKAMTDERLQQPSKPLNVNITPGTAEAFDDRCRALRLKKKDVVEVLLRAWLASSAAR